MNGTSRQANERVKIFQADEQKSHAEILKGKDEITKWQGQATGTVNIGKEVRNVIGKSEKLLRDTVKKNESIPIFGSQEKGIKKESRQKHWGS